MSNYEIYNNSEASFRIFCDTLLSTDICKNLIIESLSNDIELKVNTNTNKIIFNNDLIFNDTMDFYNKPLRVLTSINAEHLNLSNNIVSSSNINITSKLLTSNFFLLTKTNVLQDLSKTLFHTITIVNNSSVLVDINIALKCSYAYKERITIELWRDTSMILQSNKLGFVNATGGIIIPYSITYLDENLGEGQIKYYLKYQLENNIRSINQGISILSTSYMGSSSIVLREITDTSVFSNKTIFTNPNPNPLNPNPNPLNPDPDPASKITTTTSEIQDLSAVLFNTIDVLNRNVQININLNLFCCYGKNERIVVQLWRDSSMISQSKELGTVNATNGLTIPYSFSYLDENLVNGPKKYYLKYKLKNNISNQEQGIVNLNTLNSIGSSYILLESVLVNNNNLKFTNNNPFTTTTRELQDLSGQLYKNIDVLNPSSILVDLNITFFYSYAYKERISIELWRDLSMVSKNEYTGNVNATGGLTNIYRLFHLDKNVSAGLKKYYLKYKIESNELDNIQPDNIQIENYYSNQEQGIISVQGSYYNIGHYDNNLQYNVLSYTNMSGGYILNTSIGYNPAIEGDKGNAIGRQDAYFSFIDVAGTESYFNDSLYVKQNLFTDRSSSMGTSLIVNTVSIDDMLYKLDTIVNYISEFSNNKIIVEDLSTTNIGVSNELYVYNNSSLNDLMINGQILSNSLKVPNEFTIDPYEHLNNSGSLIINGDLTVKGNKKIIRYSIFDISSFTIKIANNLSNINDLAVNQAGLDVSNIASLKYNGLKWNISGGSLFIGTNKVALDISLSDLKYSIYDSLTTLKYKFETSFNLLQINLDSSFSITTSYTKDNINNLFVTKTVYDNSYNYLSNYIINSFVLKQTYISLENNTIEPYLSKYYVTTSISGLNTKLNLFALKSVVEASYNNLKTQFETSFVNLNISAINSSSITIDTITTSKLESGAKTTKISGDLLVIGDTCLNSLNISNIYAFNNNGYSSTYMATSAATSTIEEYYSKFNNYGKVLSILADGSLYYLSGIGGLSDIRLKENIVDTSPKLEDFLKIRIVDYNLKTNPYKKYTGVLAQELEEIFPGLVTQTDSNANNSEYIMTEKYKSVKYSCFNIMLIKAIQEQQQIIVNLTLRLKALKKR